MTEVFQDAAEDGKSAHRGFQRWRAAHPEGFVLNIRGADSILHRTSCDHFGNVRWGASAAVGSLTRTPKAVSDVVQELIDYAVRTFSVNPKICTDCRPDTHSEREQATTLDKATAGPDDYKTKLPAMRDWLIGMACNRTAITYGDVMNAFDLGHRNLQRAMSLLGEESRQQREPILTALIVSKATGRCSSGLEKEFGVPDDAAERTRLYDFWHKRGVRLQQMPVQSPLEQRAARFAQVETRPGQAAFRRAVFLACQGKCVVSACDIPFALDAAHRAGRDWRLGQNSSDDGYLLRKDLHALYDAGLLKISGDGIVQLDPAVVQHYQQFDGIKVPA